MNALMLDALLVPLDYFHLRVSSPDLRWFCHGSTAALRTTASVYLGDVREICWQQCNGNVTVLSSETAIGHR
jgi:hypothetical protein